MAALVLVEFEIARVAVGATLEMVLRIIFFYVFCRETGLFSGNECVEGWNRVSCGEESGEKSRRKM